MASFGSPTVRRRRLAAELRRLRGSRTGTEVSRGVGWSPTKVSRAESGRESIPPAEVEKLLDYYGVADPLRGRLLSLAEDATQHGWWDQYADALTPEFMEFIGLEEEAVSSLQWQVDAVPGLFQTEDYARAVTRLGLEAASAAETERRVGLRVKRQDLLTRTNPPKIWSVMDEAVLRRPAGGPAVMRAQFRHLIEVAEFPHVTLQVLPFASGGHVGESGTFTVLRFEERDLPDVVYLEQLTGAIYLDQRSDVEHYLEVVDELSVEALTPEETTSFIEQVARKI